LANAWSLTGSPVNLTEVNLKNTNLYKTLNNIFRLAIVAASLGFIYWKVFAGGNLKELAESITSYTGNPHFLRGIILLMLLMLLNWAVESVKWQQLVRRAEPISFFKSFQSVLAGVTVSIFTPNRTGEFIGRAFILKKSEPFTAVLLTLVGSFSQLIVTLMLGSLALIFSYKKFLPAGVIVPDWANIGVISGIVMMNIFLVLAFLNLPFFGKLTEKTFNGRFSRFAKYIQAIGAISRKELIRVWLLSLLRYLIFSFQFFLILRIFGIMLPVIPACYIIPVIYLALAIVPTIALSELGVRGSVSLYFIGAFLLQARGIPMSESEALSVVLAAGSLWVINLAVPALAGIPFVFKLRFFRK